MDKICETIRKSDSEFKSLYINEFGPMYVLALFMTLLIMGVVFIGWNGEFKCRIKVKKLLKKCLNPSHFRQSPT